MSKFPRGVLGSLFSAGRRDVAEARLSAAHRETVRRLLLVERLRNREIVDHLAGLGVVVTEQAISYYRRQLLPEIQASDLEAIQAGAAAFVARFSALSKTAKALLEASIDQEGTLKKPSKYSSLDLDVLSKIQAELTRLTMAAEDRIYKREKLEVEREKCKLDSERLKLEKARDAREAERHNLDMLAARRELDLLKLEDDAAAVGVGEDEGGGHADSDA
jgi:hypothetical protein